MVKPFAIAGGIIPVVLMLVKFVELKNNPEAIPYSSLYGFYMWPTSIMLGEASDVFELKAVVWLLVSILANVTLYLIIGSFLAQFVALIGRSNRRGPHTT